MNLLSINYVKNNIANTPFEVTSEIIIDTSFFSEELSVWDSVDKEYIYEHFIQNREKHLVSFNIDIKLNILKSDSQNTISSIEVDNEQLIEIDLDDYTRKWAKELDSYDSRDEEIYTCPGCGKKYGYRNDGGNGFCSDCASDH